MRIQSHQPEILKIQWTDTVAKSAGLQWGGGSQAGALPVLAAFNGPLSLPFSASVNIVWDYMRLPSPSWRRGRCGYNNVFEAGDWSASPGGEATAQLTGASFSSCF